MSDDKQNADRIAMFNLHFDHGNCLVELVSEKAFIKNTETILVREVLPSEITMPVERLRKIIAETIGFGSMCWTESPKGIFRAEDGMKYLDGVVEALKGAKEAK